MKLFGWGERNESSKEVLGIKAESAEKTGQSWADRLSRMCGFGKGVGAAEREMVTKNTEDGDPLRNEAQEICKTSDAQIEAVIDAAQKEILQLEKAPVEKPHKAKSFSAADNMAARQRQQGERLKSKEQYGKTVGKEKEMAREDKENRQKIGTMEGIKRMNEYIAKTTTELREKEGIPVGDDWRIQREAYLEGGIVGQAEYEQHSEKIRVREAQFAERKQAHGQNPEVVDFGDEMEKFVTAIFHKFFGDEYVVARTDRYSDINGIDSMLVNRRTGEIIGAFDAVVGRRKTDRIEEKKSKTFLKNCKGNGKLTYGLGIGDNGDIIKQRRDGEDEAIPVLYLGLSTQELATYLSKIDFSNEKITALEANVMKEFIGSIGEQLEEVGDFKKLGAESNLHKTYTALNEKVENLTAQKINV